MVLGIHLALSASHHPDHDPINLHEKFITVYRPSEPTKVHHVYLQPCDSIYQHDIRDGRPP